MTSSATPGPTFVVELADDDPLATDSTGTDDLVGRMNHRLPTLVQLAKEVRETEVWPELAASLGNEAGEVGPHERRWLTVATLHRSALYEDEAISSVVSRGCLSLLQGVGKSVLEVELQTAIGVQDPRLDLAQRNDERKRLHSPVRHALIGVLGVADHACLGVGEQQQSVLGRASRSLETVMLQLVGWWSLLLPGRTIRTSVRQVHTAAATEGEGVSNWRTLFEQRFNRLGPQFTSTRKGPDHAPIFESTVTTRDGRSGTGSASSKKDAARFACRDYVRRYAPELLTPAATGPSPISVVLPITAEQRRLASLFGVPDASLFSKALTHASWIFENTRQRDSRVSNEVLANLGSSVLGVLATRTRAASLMRTTAQPDPELSIELTVPDENLVPLGESLGLRAAARLGVGQQQQGVSVEMMANFVQAVLAAAYVQAGTAEAFEARLPDVVADFLVEQSGRSMRDAATRLQELAVELNLEWPWTDIQTGPDHARSYINTLRISGGSATVVVEGTGPRRSEALKAAAAVAMAAAELRSRVPATLDRPDIARFFLMRQLEVLAAKPNSWPRWQQQNVLGALHVADRNWTAFGRWVDSARQTGILDRSLPADAKQSLAAFYQRAARSAGARPWFANTLAGVLRWVAAATADDRTILQPKPWEDLVALTAAHSVWLTPDHTVDLADRLERWAQPERRQVPVEIEVAGPASADAQAAAAVIRILHEFRYAAAGLASALQVSLVSGNDTHEIRVSPATRQMPQSVSLVALVCEAAPGVSVANGDDGTTVRVARRSIGSGWLWEAAIRTHPTDEFDVELARLLHDLKNEVTGARTALTRPTVTRTERREADWDASRHIDSAAALAASLVDADFLYHSTPAGSCELASFLRGYCSDLITRLPSGIRVIPPVTTRAPVGVSAAVLRGALDNLVKNAVEAMRDDGQIEFDYTLLEGDGVVLLEVRDTGPGLSDEVFAALQARGPAPSSKRYGSGLGLPGVMRMMRRAGSDLQPLQAGSGGAWLMRLPLTEDNAAADG